MLLRIKLAAFASIIVASGAAETPHKIVIDPQSETTADSTHRELYGSPDDDEVLRRVTCPDDEWCDTRTECRESEAAENHGWNGDIRDNTGCMGGCVLKEDGRVSWITNQDFDKFRGCAPDRFSRVCCGPRNLSGPTVSPTESPTESPTLYPTWLDDSWGGDTWNGGSSSNNKWGWSGGSSNNNNNKWGWSGSSNNWNGGSSNNKWGWSGGSTSNNWNGGSNNNKWGWSGSSNNWNGGSNSNNMWGWSGGSRNDDWGGWEPSMKQWNHDGWHQDGWQDDGWNDDGHNNRNGWEGDDNKDDDRANARRCDLSDCCEAVENPNFSLYKQFLRTANDDNRCRLRGDDGGTGEREKCNKRGFCYATGENCQPSDCR